MSPQIIVRDIGPGGTGGEADVFIQIRNLFPGIGGTIRTKQAAYVALRKEFNTAPHTGDRTFLRHLIMKKLDDFFCRSGLYLAPHVTRPFGSVSNSGNNNEEASVYEWVWGEDGLPCTSYTANDEREMVKLDEWSKFVSAFGSAGVSMEADITDPDNGWISKNIIHQHLEKDKSSLNLCWYRIDLGSSSLPIDFKLLARFLEDQARLLKQLLGANRFKLLELAHKGLSGEISLTGREWGGFEVLIQEYRKSTLRHLGPEIVNDN